MVVRPPVFESVMAVGFVDEPRFAVTSIISSALAVGVNDAETADVVPLPTASCVSVPSAIAQPYSWMIPDACHVITMLPPFGVTGRDPTPVSM